MATQYEQRPEETFEFSHQQSENSLGNFLKGIFANSGGNIPEAIQSQFSNPNAIPKEFENIPTNLRKPETPHHHPKININNNNNEQEGHNYNSVEITHHQRALEGDNQSIMNGEKVSPTNNNNNNASNNEQNLSIVPTLPDTGQQYCDITDYLNMPQNLAAKKLQIPSSTLSKRWKEAARSRKWPWRTVRKIDKEITTLLHNIPPGGAIPEEIEANLAQLLRKRQEELKPVVIRL